MLDFFKNLPNPIKVGLPLLVVAGAAILGLKIDIPSDSKPAKEPADLVTVEFIVETKELKPIKDAEVRFISKNAPESRSTDSNGFVRIDIPSRNDVDIVITKNGFQTYNATIDLQKDPKRTRTIKLEPISSETAPNPTTPSPITPISTINQICQRSLKSDNFIFEIRKCNKINSGLSFELVIKNVGRTQDFYLYSDGTRIFDNSGNENHAKSVMIGDRPWGNSSGTTIPLDTSIKANIRFDEVFIEGGKIALLEIKTSLASKIEFRDIPVSQ